jgi:Rnl2 family RNA ligase
VKSSHADVDTVHVFGELFGGAYPHPDVAKLPGVVHVQKFLWYCPHTEFFGFDISINSRGFMNFDDMITLFKKHKFFYSLPLRRGTYEHCLEWEVEGFQTTIPPLLGMPELKDNFAEGVCIRTVKNSYLSNKLR